MTSYLPYIAFIIFVLTTDLGASASATRRSSELPTNSVSGGQTPSTSEEQSNNDRRLVQKYEPPPPGSNQFEGYSCNSNKDCFNEGRCMSTEFGGSVCNCTDSWLGPQCEFSSTMMEYQLFHRPLVRYMFFTCLNSTGFEDNVHAYSVYQTCSPGNSACWIRRGGVDAIKVFFWCLNTGYRMLLAEGRASKEARWGLYEGALEALTERFGGLPEESPQFGPVEGEVGSVLGPERPNPVLSAKKSARNGGAFEPSIDDIIQSDYYGAPDADDSFTIDMP